MSGNLDKLASPTTALPVASFAEQCLPWQEEGPGYRGLNKACFARPVLLRGFAGFRVACRQQPRRPPPTTSRHPPDRECPIESPSQKNKPINVYFIKKTCCCAPSGHHLLTYLLTYHYYYSQWGGGGAGHMAFNRACIARSVLLRGFSGYVPPVTPALTTHPRADVKSNNTLPKKKRSAGATTTPQTARPQPSKAS